MLAMLDFMVRHRIHPVIDRTYPFEEFEQAYRDLEAGRSFGKLVLVL
jgi:NADPH:quinone reductase-like Zn-dependent oxidoreductase